MRMTVTFPYVMGWRLLRWCSVWSSCGVPDGVGHPMLWSSRRGLLEAQMTFSKSMQHGWKGHHRNSQKTSLNTLKLKKTESEKTWVRSILEHATQWPQGHLSICDGLEAPEMVLGVELLWGP
ncbi:uncharacterized protein LOC143765697 isoform X5 [Ranitomeya variabilis]|uniref:uncharacterized protein LOC143765697 isoform X5 n=1 Tax=Ranitomeya variabilis TaxID=490064 RepID=UPI0040575E96